MAEIRQYQGQGLPENARQTRTGEAVFDSRAPKSALAVLCARKPCQRITLQYHCQEHR